MKNIAFIHNMDMENQEKWLAQFTILLPNEIIVVADQLTDEQASQVELAIVANPSVDALKRFPNLIWVQSLWAGVETMVNTFRSINQGKTHPTQLVRLIDPYLANTMAEAALTWSLYLYRNIPEYMAQQKQNLWRPIPCPAINTVHVSVLGTGELGTAAMQALVNQGFNVNSWSRNHKDIANVTHYSEQDGLFALLKKTDILICLLPLTDQTHKLLSKETLSLLPKGAKIINFARGGIVNHDDLINALDTDHLSHAVLDVFEQEPLTENSPLWQHPKLSILPHISATTNLDTASKIVADNITRYREHGTIPDTVDLLRGY
ncbi:2-hydroxyacid dehydrogenase [Marinomonas sp. 2405UD68-3]|uniref:2-hydroxyacid dehydrogenase n=1 Tax=Marinomonas sp. 2405UD68-3 TaxID=3391835 RepID=UPI0039C93856